MSDDVLREIKKRLDREREKAEALEKNATNFIANALKSDKIKENLSKEGLQVMQEGRSGRNPIRDAIRGGDAKFNGLNQGECTGFEPRPWEDD